MLFSPYNSFTNTFLDEFFSTDYPASVHFDFDFAKIRFQSVLHLKRAREMYLLNDDLK